MKSLPDKLQQKLKARDAQQALRTLPSFLHHVDFYSNDYLGFAHSDKIIEYTEDLLSVYTNKSGATGSRLISGNHELYPIVEQKIADFHQVDTALLFNSGYNANVGFFSSVPQRGDLVFYDELIHASIRDGMQLSLAKSYKFKHNNLSDLKEKIDRLAIPDQCIYVVIESVYSMDGDSPNLQHFAEYCDTNNYLLVIDEAHSLGVFGSEGEGLVQYLGLQEKVFAQIMTYGKALGVHGAAILCKKDLYSYLVNYARSLIYTTAMPPHTVASIGAGYQILSTLSKTHYLKNLRRNISHFQQELKRLELAGIFIPSYSAIHCCLISGNEKVKFVAQCLQNKGFGVKAILSPTVSKDEERLRFCLHAYNDLKQITEVLEQLKLLLEK